jgi:GNAT superfamily N-acetyltransferase
MRLLLRLYTSLTKVRKVWTTFFSAQQQSYSTEPSIPQRLFCEATHLTAFMSTAGCSGTQDTNPSSMKECHTLEDIQSTYRVMRQLRPQFTDPEKYLQVVQSLIANENYKLIALYHDGACVGVAGYQVGERLSLGRILYVADLVVDESWRGNGIGKKLMKYLEAVAHMAGAVRIVLESGVTRVSAHAFYKGLGYTADSLSFRKGLPGPLAHNR